MSHPSPGPSGTRPARIAVVAIVAVCVVVPLLVGRYDAVEPRLAGFPFFYWFQFALIPVVSGLTYLSFRLLGSTSARARRQPEEEVR